MIPPSERTLTEISPSSIVQRSTGSPAAVRPKSASAQVMAQDVTRHSKHDEVDLMAAHPLDPLTADEFTSVVAVVAVGLRLWLMPR